MKNPSLITYQYKSMKSIEGKINIMTTLISISSKLVEFCIIQRVNKSSKYSPRVIKGMITRFRQLRVDGSFVGINSVDPISSYV